MHREWILPLGVLASSGVGAQAPQSDVLTGSGVTREKIEDALEPSAGAGAAAVSQRASASLLITFRTDSAELTADAKRQLDTLTGAMKSDRLAPCRFTVEGHADPRGETGRNLTLSMYRERFDAISLPPRR